MTNIGQYSRQQFTITFQRDFSLPKTLTCSRVRRASHQTGTDSGQQGRHYVNYKNPYGLSGWSEEIDCAPKLR